MCVDGRARARAAWRAARRATLTDRRTRQTQDAELHLVGTFARYLRRAHREANVMHRLTVRPVPGSQPCWHLGRGSRRGRRSHRGPQSSNKPRCVLRLRASSIRYNNWRPGLSSSWRRLGAADTEKEAGGMYSASDTLQRRPAPREWTRPCLFWLDCLPQGYM